jgi:signal transduction histidine kinase
VILEKRLKNLPRESWQPTIDRARKNLDRLLEMQYQIDDIMLDKTDKARKILSHLLDQCADELEVLVAEQIGEGQIVKRIKKGIEEAYCAGGSGELIAEKIQLDTFVANRLELLRSSFAHRQVDIITRFSATAPISIPPDPLQKVIDGLIKNAIENTPDEGKLEVVVKRQGEGTLLEVCDFGVGITKENKTRIFEGFFTTQETMDYSSKRPFDFNAGGKGADLLRMKIFSERYDFKIGLKSSRCPFIPKNGDPCPGIISKCPHCKDGSGCHQSVATIFSIYFPPAR